MEQLVLYAYPNDMVPVDALVYLDIAMSRAADAEDSGEGELIELPFKTLESRILFHINQYDCNIVPAAPLVGKVYQLTAALGGAVIGKNG